MIKSVSYDGTGFSKVPFTSKGRQHESEDSGVAEHGPVSFFY